jgi:hypothetical protein
LDFWLFGRIETGLVGCSFADPEEILEDVPGFLEEVHTDGLTAVFEGWIDRT